MHAFPLARKGLLWVFCILAIRVTESLRNLGTLYGQWRTALRPSERKRQVPIFTAWFWVPSFQIMQCTCAVSMVRPSLYVWVVQGYDSNSQTPNHHLCCSTGHSLSLLCGFFLLEYNVCYGSLRLMLSSCQAFWGIIYSGVHVGWQWKGRYNQGNVEG